MARCIPSYNGQFIAHLSDDGGVVVGDLQGVESAARFLTELRRDAWRGTGVEGSPFCPHNANTYLAWANSLADALEQAAERRARLQAEQQAKEAA